jgi:putative membrane protein
LSAPQPNITNYPLPLWRRAVLAASVLAFALLWVGGVSSQWLGRAHAGEGYLASLFLLLAGLIVLLGTRTRRNALSLSGVALLGFAVEVVGARTGFPFGEYDYTGVLRPQLLGVPIAMGFAWMALVASASDLAGRLGLPPWPTVLIAALWTTANDLVIDPLAANHLGYWTWVERGSYYDIPFTNFVGWFLTALVACRMTVTRRPSNFWAGFVGTAILLFFASIALAHSLLVVALIGFGLCALRPWLSRRLSA